MRLYIIMNIMGNAMKIVQEDMKHIIILNIVNAN